MWIELQARKDGPGPNWEAMGVKPKKGQAEYYYVRKLVWSSNIVDFEETGYGELLITFIDGEKIYCKNEFDYLKDLLESEEEITAEDCEQTEDDLII